MHKPVDELVRAAAKLSKSDPYCQSTWWLACMIAPNDTLSNHANFTPPMQASLLQSMLTS